MTEPSVISFTETKEKFIIYRKSFFCEQFWVYNTGKTDRDPIGNLHFTKYDDRKVVWTNTIKLLQNYASKDKYIFSATETSGIKLVRYKHYWMTVKWFPSIFGSYLKQYDEYKLKTYTFQELKEANAENFFINE